MVPKRPAVMITATALNLPGISDAIRSKASIGTVTASSGAVCGLVAAGGAAGEAEKLTPNGAEPDAKPPAPEPDEATGTLRTTGASTACSGTAAASSGAMSAEATVA